MAEQIKLGRKFTQRGMRRTFNDLTRAAKVEAIVTRSISGHLTERMQERWVHQKPPGGTKSGTPHPPSGTTDELANPTTAEAATPADSAAQANDA